MLHLAAEGWVCVANNYRLSPKATFPDHLVDCKQALAWVREHIAEYGGDPDFVVVTGGSAGGHLAALVALTANEPRVPARLRARRHERRRVRAVLRRVRPRRHVPDAPTARRPPTRGSPARVMKTTIAENRAAVRVRVTRPPRATPTRRRSSSSTATSDNLVPVAQARAFVAALRAVSGQPVVYAEIAGGSHAFDVFHSVRTGNAVNGVDRFLAWVYSAYEARCSSAESIRPTPRSTRLAASRQRVSARRRSAGAADAGS